MDDWDVFTLEEWIEMLPGRYRERPTTCRIQHRQDDTDDTATHVYAWMGVNEVEELILCKQHSQEFILHNNETAQ